jgi:dienelactone hydrolase
VAAADHTGNAAAEFADRDADAPALTQQAQRDAYIRRIIGDRVPDLRFLVDEMLSGAAGEVSDQIDDQRIGLIGWSFGGWAVLAVPEVDDRVRGVVALAPAGSSKPLPGIIPATLTFEWTREVPTLYLVAERDQYTPLSGMYELFDRTPSSKAMYVLRHADHGHFGDHIEDERCPQQHAHLFTRGLALAHVDAVLQDLHAAQQFMAHDPAAALRARGVEALAYGPSSSACGNDRAGNSR